MKTAISAILGTVLFFQFLATGLSQIPEEKCIDFETLPFNVNFTETIEPGDVLLEEDGVIITAEELYGRFNWSMVLNSPNCRPNVYNGRHLVLDHGIQLDFTRLPKQPNLVLFSVGICDGIQFIRVNNGKIIEIPSNSTFNKEVSLGVTVLYLSLIHI